MRFKRYYRIEQFQETPRKRAGCLRSQKRERDKLPLLAELIRAQQPTVDEVMAQRAIDTVRWQQETRDRRAAKWREARRRLNTYGPNARAALLEYWQTCKWPGDPTYLLDMLHMFDKGRLDLDRTRGSLR